MNYYKKKRGKEDKYMLYVIFCAVLFGRLTYDDFIGFFSAFMGGLAGVFFGFAMWLTIGGQIGTMLMLPTKEVQVVEQEIYALGDSSSIEGEKFLFVGSINEELVYRYVVNTDKGKCIETVKADANNVYVIEGDYTPTIKVHTLAFKDGLSYLFAHDIFIKDYIEFYIPEGTVTCNKEL